MLDTFLIGIPDGGWEYDETLDEDVQTITPLFTTKGRVKAANTIPLEREVGGRTSIEVRRELSIPVDSPVVPPGAIAVCTAVDPTSDPTLLGARLTLAGASPSSQTTARRLTVEEVVA